MAIAVDSASNGTGNTATSLTWSHTCSGENRFLIVAVQVGDGQTYNITGVTYNSVALTKIGAVNGVGRGEVALWYLIAPDTGAHNVVVSKGSSGFMRAGSVSYTGVKQSLQPDATGSNSTASATGLTTSVTTVADNCWTVMLVAGTSTVSAGAGTFIRASVQGTSDVKIADSNGALTPPGSKSLVVTGGSGAYISYMASFSPYIPPTGGSPMFFGGGVAVG